MLIQGPLRFSVAQNDQSSSYELFVDFQPDFRDLPLGPQGASFRNYLNELRLLITNANDHAKGTPPDLFQAERTLQGLLIVQQIAEQLLPHIESGDLDLEETINIHVRPDSPEVSLIDLLRRNELA
jgi:hypothetical protein